MGWKDEMGRMGIPALPALRSMSAQPLDRLSGRVVTTGGTVATAADALGIASMFLLERDFDGASRALDAARSRSHDRDEQKFLIIAIGDPATITRQ